MRTVIVTGSGGLVGSEAVRYYQERADLVIGIDNDLRASFFGDEASTAWKVAELKNYPAYRHEHADIRDATAINTLFSRHGADVELVVHTAAQPSHDWAARDPLTDFSVNATGTLNLLEATRNHAADAVFVHCSTNKVYGDRPNELPLNEGQTRWTVDSDHPFSEHGIDESMSVDATTHSLFGASKLASDCLAQEYGRYFGLKTGIFRGGCLTGPSHSGAQLHGFLAYLMKCAHTGTPYTVFGYKAKQVRDNIHASDLINAFDHFRLDPKPGEVYNIGGGVKSNCSMLEAISLCEQISGNELDWSYDPTNRVGDHIHYVSDLRKFERDHPAWSLTYDVPSILEEIHAALVERDRVDSPVASDLVVA